MPRETEIILRYGTRAALDSVAAVSGLLKGEPFLLDDESRFGVGLSPGTYQLFAKQGEGGSAPISQIEVNLGYPARRSGRFTITGTGLIVGKPVNIWIARGPYSGKGALAGEEAMYPGFSLSAAVTSPTQISASWICPWRVGGPILFNYQIGG
jgi:hypothetical protein